MLISVYEVCLKFWVSDLEMANSADPIRLLLKEQSDLGMHCLSEP